MTARHPGLSSLPLALTSDKARYAPGETVVFTLSAAPPIGARVRYEHLDSVVADVPATRNTWAWMPPARDFTGYMAEVYRDVPSGRRVLATCGIDVSSRWTRFPRYGFLSRYPALSRSQIDTVIGELARHHIDGLQFYDWQYKHHEPLAGTPADPTPIYQDIGGRLNHFATVRDYIDAAHARNMSAMFYDLVYGAWTGASADGVSIDWHLYTDRTHAARDGLRLPQPPFVSDIWLLDPANAGWQRYLAGQTGKLYAALPFDGFHMDQVGERPTAEFTYAGQPVDLATTFQSFISAMSAAHPDKYHVMNAVNQYGQPGIARAPTDFLYTEVWPPHDSYASLAEILRTNDSLANGTRNSVLAAYVDYDLANRPGYFNTPGVLYADAVIFAFGGAHIELGEHMLGKEYFPNDNLRMRDDLEAGLVPYYDFLVAYENLLRDGGAFDTPRVWSSDMPIAPWPGQLGDVAVVGRRIGNRQVLHLLNFVGATTLHWRDADGSQRAPRPFSPATLRMRVDRPVRRIWVASPDVHGGASSDLVFTQTAGVVSFTVPWLAYWDMVVVEFQ